MRMLSLILVGWKSNIVSLAAKHLITAHCVFRVMRPNLPHLKTCRSVVVKTAVQHVFYRKMSRQTSVTMTSTPYNDKYTKKDSSMKLNVEIKTCRQTYTDTDT